MTMGDVCTRDVVAVQRTDTVLDVARVMRDRHVGDVVVLSDEPGAGPLGMLTDRDIVVGIVAVTPDKLEMLQVNDVMSGELATVSVADSLDTALGIMRDRGVRRLPVLETSGGLAGIVTFDDIVGVLARSLADLATVVGRERRQEERMRAARPEHS